MMRDDLEASHKGEWVLVHDQKLIDTYETFQKAAAVASRQFGRRPYLIRRIGEGPLRLSSSIMYGIR